MSCQLNVRPFCQVLDVAVLVQRAEAALEARSLITHIYKATIQYQEFGNMQQLTTL